MKIHTPTATQAKIDLKIPTEKSLLLELLEGK